MIITSFIVDDEPHAVETLTGYVIKTPGMKLIGSTTDPIKAVPEISENFPTLTFVDVDMPGISGLTLAELVSGKTIVVFVTSFKEFGPEAFELMAADYLLKPVSYKRFLKCIERIRDKFIPHEIKPAENCLFVKGELKGKYIRINYSSIQYINSSLHYVDIVLDNEKITTYLTLGELISKLPEKDFCRVHRSYIVNLNKIKAIEQAQIRLENKELIPIGRGYREDFFQRISSSLPESQKESNL